MKRNVIIGGILVAALGLGGFLLIQNGNDAVSAANSEKGSILTAEQVNVSFQGVGGRVINVNVEEEKHVKKGDVLMVLDPTDLNLQIAKMQSDIHAMDINIKKAEDSIRVGEKKVATQVEQAQLGVNLAATAESKVLEGARREELERQEYAVKSAEETYRNAKLNYDRSVSLYSSGAISKAALDNAQTQLTTAESAWKQQQKVFEQLKTGAQVQDKNQAKLNTAKAQLGVDQALQAKDDLHNNAIGVELLKEQRQALQIQLQSLQVQKSRLTLVAPTDGKVVRVVPKQGENVSAGTPVIILETDKLYYDFYVNELQVNQFKVGKPATGHLIALNKDITGEVRFITVAPQFASLRMSREKGQSDLSSFQVRVYIDRNDEAILPGMTIEVNVQ